MLRQCRRRGEGERCRHALLAIRTYPLSMLLSSSAGPVVVPSCYVMLSAGSQRVSLLSLRGNRALACIAWCFWCFW